MADGMLNPQQIIVCHWIKVKAQGQKRNANEVVVDLQGLCSKLKFAASPLMLMTHNVESTFSNFEI